MLQFARLIRLTSQVAEETLCNTTDTLHILKANNKWNLQVFF